MAMIGAWNGVCHIITDQQILANIYWVHTMKQALLLSVSLVSVYFSAVT